MSVCPHCRREQPETQMTCAACGQPMQLPGDDSTGLIIDIQLRFIDPYSGTEFHLPSPATLMIGRGDAGWTPEIDVLPLAHDANHGLSRRHAQVAVQGCYVTVRDLNSTNGTQLNGTPLHPQTPYALHDGDRLTFGRVDLIFRAT